MYYISDFRKRNVSEDKEQSVVIENHWNEKYTYVYYTLSSKKKFVVLSLVQTY